MELIKSSDGIKIQNDEIIIPSKGIGVFTVTSDMTELLTHIDRNAVI